ncbi:HNH endonuclease [Corynebacterium sp. MSK041]|uniref:HNH endonuclease n=1 Tax=Corynebacterium sp. MSK041 TaxID=3050194 RepID=UPI00254B0D1A|nr:HNH endonuclease [Corynebacterium sp. MSK041]MDK8794227.1 HNH endonuclease [Corynebacterium sp. MSK041]
MGDPKRWVQLPRQPQREEAHLAWSNKGHVSATTRRRILSRDNYTCQNCGHKDITSASLEIDHKNNTRNATYNTDANLQALCCGCHHRKTLRETREGHRRRVARGRYPMERHPGLI